MPKVSFRMASASRESVFGVQTNTARKIHRSDHTEGRLTTAPSGCRVRKGASCERSMGKAISRLDQHSLPLRRLSASRVPLLAFIDSRASPLTKRSTKDRTAEDPTTSPTQASCFGR
jgi:hypothetical protein